ncbi:hypothetical protein O181_003776 [Austropuccinia psidii MF-1]|uniref:Reverse transcriptase Ty1/copia-type domain-containing protein n=1 Tax=Austropuccinia psidii MF-1 TaxID=1389203 RepID=A0A9Q3BFL2_9BASI|nr:hypothetical protein [Austropuccinia psidii MF-1]
MRKAGQCWWVFISNILANLGFNESEVDQSFYVFKKGGIIIVILMHVNDRIISSNCPEAIQNFKHTIRLQLDVKWKDSISRIVSLECVFGEGLGQQPSVVDATSYWAKGTSLAAIRPPSWLPAQNPPHGHHIEAQDALPQHME